VKPIGVFVRNRHGQPIEELAHGRENRRRVRKLRKDDEPHRQKRCAARDREVDHRQHPVGVRVHAIAIEGIREVGLACGGRVSNHVAHRSPRGLIGSLIAGSRIAPSRTSSPSIVPIGLVTTRVL
jgi:hypothetical protein